MQLEFIDDDILDHTPLDAKVYELLQSDRNNASLHPAIILLVVVSSAPNSLDQTFRDFITANDIVEKYSLDPDGDENSNLRELLRSCWRQGKFAKIRCLSEHSFTNLLVFKLIMSHKIAEFLQKTQTQTDWRDSDRYT
jgi:hypothetical protein